MELETRGKFNVLPPRPYASGRLHRANWVHAQCTVTVVIRKQIAVRTYFVHSSPHALKHTLAPRGLVSK